MYLREPVPRDTNEDHFSRFAPEPPAVIPPGATGSMSFRTTSELIAERKRAEAHWTHRFPEWLKKKLKTLFYRPHA